MAGRARRRAIAEAQLRFGPQERVLVDALGTARSGALAQIRTARGTSSALQAAVRRARKPLKREYARAEATATAARGDLIGHLGALGPAAAPFSAAVAREQAGTISRSAQERANALRGLSLMGVQAAEGGVAAELNARSQLQQQRADIGKQLQGIEADKGAFTVSQLEDIRAADRAFREQKRGHDLTYKASTRNSRRTAASNRARLDETKRHNQATERTAAARVAGKGRKNKVTGSQSGHAIDQIALARQTIRTYAGHQDRASIRAWLHKGESLKDKTTGKVVDKVPKVTNAGPISSDALITAAFELEYHQHLSAASRRALRGVHLPRAWKRSPGQARARSRRAGQTARSSLGF